MTQTTHLLTKDFDILKNKCDNYDDRNTFNGICTLF